MADKFSNGASYRKISFTYVSYVFSHGESSPVNYFFVSINQPSSSTADEIFQLDFRENRLSFTLFCQYRYTFISITQCLNSLLKMKFSSSVVRLITDHLDLFLDSIETTATRKQHHFRVTLTNQQKSN